MSDQYFWKRIPEPSRGGKLELFWFMELNLTCAVMLFKLRDWILRISLRHICFPRPAEDFQGLAGSAELGILEKWGVKCVVLLALHLCTYFCLVKALRHSQSGVVGACLL